MANQSQWNSRTAFLLSMIGAAVGLGNIWRYSYVVYTNGGGTFLIPYLIAILIMGIPFLIMEYGVGFRHKDSYSNILKGIHPKLEYLSWITVFIVFSVVVYYLVIVAWDLVYIGSSINFSWGKRYRTLFYKKRWGKFRLIKYDSNFNPNSNINGYNMVFSMVHYT